MRQLIYGISLLIIFMALILGIDNYFGPEVRIFSITIFTLWAIQVVTGNWKEIKTLYKILLPGLDSK